EGEQSRRNALRNVGLGLVACEKTVQRYYELNLRPEEKRHMPWLDRVTGQMATAFHELDRIVKSGQSWLHGERMMQDDLTIAVAWRFAQFVTPEALPPADYPALNEFSRRAETLQEFISCPLE
ncbi:MAG: glutathione S-transferase C-terminal domain-containing protein, partial [Betaproteobacteria bacterium]